MFRMKCIDPCGDPTVTELICPSNQILNTKCAVKYHKATCECKQGFIKDLKGNPWKGWMGCKQRGMEISYSI